jgi:5-methyltetrahydrofolate--homocysteine methyltransferase
MGSRGLDLAITDVLDPQTVSTARSLRILSGSLEQVEMKLPELDPQSAVPDFLRILQKSIIIGDRRQTEASARELLEGGMGAADILKEGLAPAMDRVGDLYARRKLFLPHLIASAEASRVLTGLLAPHLSREGAPESRGRVVLASVRGDVHDIGKNLVALFLSNAGFSVIDLGRDVPAEEIVTRAGEERADIIALSALMSTTAPQMEKVITLARQRGSEALVLVGGAVLTRDYADSIGADGYARDAHGAVGEATRLMGSRD